MAPSAHNSQDYKFIIIKDSETKKALQKAAAEQEFISQAPIVIAAIALKPEDILECNVHAYAVDTAIAIDHMTLAAVEEGLGTCWVGAFDQKQVKEILKVPKNYKVVAILPLGTPYDDPSPKLRKSIKELFCYEEFFE